ncbi:MAG TPA: Uma2 family endonuclease [Ktedonobacteraceae bacterium]|nr:Uma2 family endonuclease [Ktedonobacteraceae bacterium]
MAQYEYPNITIEDYQIINHNSQSARYEYLDGELRMLAGGSADHSTITANLTGILYGLLRGGPRKIYSSDMQLQLSEARYVYPDVTVTCDPRDEAPEDSRTHYPTVVIEVLSPVTEVTDRGKKLLYYQAHPTIQEYMLADSQSILIEVYRREKTRWTFSTYKLEDEAQLESLAIQFSVRDVYERTGLIRKHN